MPRDNLTHEVQEKKTDNCSLRIESRRKRRLGIYEKTEKPSIIRVTQFRSINKSPHTYDYLDNHMCVAAVAKFVLQIIFRGAQNAS